MIDDLVRLVEATHVKEFADDWDSPELLVERTIDQLAKIMLYRLKIKRKSQST